MTKDRLTRNPLMQRTQEDQKTPDKGEVISKDKSNMRTSIKRKVKGEDQGTTTQGLQPGYTRFTVIVKEDLIQNFKDYAYWERLSIKDVMEQAITEYLKDKKIKGDK